MSLLLLFRPLGTPQTGGMRATISLNFDVSGTLTGHGTPVQPDVVVAPGGAARRTPRRRPQVEPVPEVFHGEVVVTGGGHVFVTGHKDVEYPMDEEVLAFLGMV